VHNATSKVLQCQGEVDKGKDCGFVCVQQDAIMVGWWGARDSLVPEKAAA
jgi:hypothetical protein